MRRRACPSTPHHLRHRRRSWMDATSSSGLGCSCSRKVDVQLERRIGVLGLNFPRVWNVPQPGFQVLPGHVFSVGFVQQPLQRGLRGQGPPFHPWLFPMGLPHLVTCPLWLLRMPRGSIGVSSKERRPGRGHFWSLVSILARGPQCAKSSLLLEPDPTTHWL